MYGIEDILDEVNNTVLDIYTYPVVWDFTVQYFNNTTAVPVVVTATTYTMPHAQIREVTQIKIIDSWQEIDITNNYKKIGDFSNRNSPATPVYEWTWKWNIIILSEAHDIVVDYVESPRLYDLTDVTNNSDMDLPDDFWGIIKDNTLSNMLPLYYSDWIPLSDRYFQKAELRLQRLGTKYGKKYANKTVGTREPSNLQRKPRTSFSEEWFIW